MKVVIGSNGFLGSALMRYAEKNCYEEVIGVTRDNYDLWKNQSRPYSTVIWAAGTSSKPKCGRDPEACRISNVEAVKKAVEDFPCDKFVYISSVDVYDSETDDMMDEDFALVKDRDHDSNHYGRYKALGEDEAKKANSYLILRCHGFSGPTLTKNVIYDLTRNEPHLYVASDCRFQYLHTYKFSEILFKLADPLPQTRNEVINCTSPDYVTPVDIADLLQIKFMDVFCRSRDRVHNRRTSVMDVTKLKQILNVLNIAMPTSREAVINWNRHDYS